MVKGATNGHARTAEGEGWQDRADRKQIAALPRYAPGIRSAAHGWGSPAAVGAWSRVAGTSEGSHARADWPMSRSGWNVIHVTALDGPDHIEKPFTQNSWVRAALNARMNAVAGIQGRVVQRRKDSAADPVPLSPDHPLSRLLARPAGSLTGADLFGQDCVNLALDGDTFWFMRDALGAPLKLESLQDPINALPVEIVPVRGKWVQAQVDEMRIARGWRVRLRTGAWSDPYPLGAVVQFRCYSPDDPSRGFGDVEALMPELDMAWAALRYNAAVLTKGDPGCYIVYEEDLSPEEQDRRQEEADDQFQAEDAGRHKVLGGGPTIIPNTLTPKDANYTGLSEDVRTAVLAVLGVPPPIVGIFDDASDNDVKTAIEMFWKGGNGILPYLTKVARRVNVDFIQRLAIPGLPSGVEFEFDTSNVEALMLDQLDRVGAARDLAKAGVGASLSESMAICGVHNAETELGERAIAATGTIGFDKIDEHAASEARAAQPAALPGKPVAAQALPAHAREELLEQERAAQFQASSALADDVLGWLVRYEKAQLKKLAEFASGKRQLVLETREDIKGLQELTASDLEILDLSRAAWIEELEGLSGPRLREIAKAAARQEWNKLGRLGTLLQANDPAIVEAILRQSIELAEDVYGTTAGRVRQNILKALKEGTSTAPGSLRAHIRRALPEVQGSVAKAFKNKDQRAQAISRTETGRARHQAKWEQMRRSGAQWKQWVDSNDTAVREAHAVMGDPIVPMEQPFPNGLQYPHERAPGVPASETVNCRCSLRAVFTQPTNSSS